MIVKRHENRANLHQVVTGAMVKYALEVTAADTGFVTKGAHFGGPHVKWVRPPKIVLAMDRPMHYSVGHTWHLFDQRMRYPTTRISCQQLPRLDLDDFNVLILPAGDYSQPSQLTAEFAGRLKQWVREGGTLILVEGAAVWGASEKIGLVELQRVAKPAKEAAGETAPAKAKGADDEATAKRWPDSVPGAFLNATLFDQHWLTFGNAAAMDVFFQGNIFFEPLDPEKGRSVVQFSSREDVVTSGFCWPETQKLLTGKTYLAYVPQGQGHVIAFAGDPNYRAMFPSLQRLFINACLFGPGQ